MKIVLIVNISLLATLAIPNSMEGMHGARRSAIRLFQVKNPNNAKKELNTNSDRQLFDMALELERSLRAESKHGVPEELSSIIAEANPANLSNDPQQTSPFKEKVVKVVSELIAQEDAQGSELPEPKRPVVKNLTPTFLNEDPITKESQQQERQRSPKGDTNLEKKEDTSHPNNQDEDGKTNEDTQKSKHDENEKSIFTNLKVITVGSIVTMIIGVIAYKKLITQQPDKDSLAKAA